MFSWLFLKLKNELEIPREEAYAIYRLALLTRCMPGAVAQVGPHSPAMARLLAAAVGDGREIVLCDEEEEGFSGMTAAPRTLSTLPGLAEYSGQGGMRRFRGGIAEARGLLRPDLKFCFVHLLRQDLAGLRRALEFFPDRLASSGLLLVELPDGVAAAEVQATLASCLEGRDERLIRLQTSHCLIIQVPRLPAPRLSPQVRIREQGQLVAPA